MMHRIHRTGWRTWLAGWLGSAWLLGLGAGSIFAQTYDFSAVKAEFEANLDDYDGRVLAIVEQGNRGEIFRFRAGLVTDQTKTGLASASKWLSGAVVLICAERGFFSLDDRIGRYLPAFEAAGKGDITIRQCFAMTSGLSLKDPNYETTGALTLAESVDLIAAHTPVVFPPGTELDYDGDGMQVVGRICEVTTGKDWETLAREVLFDPLGATSMDYGLLRNNPAIAGGARGTAADYLKFLRMIARNGCAENGRVILSSRSVQVFFENQTLGLPERASPMPPSDFYAYGARPDYGMGSWILAQNPTNGVVEEVASPGAFGTFPWVDRRRGLCGIIFMFDLQGGRETGPTDLRIQAKLRAAIDAVGLPPVPAPGPLTVRRVDGFGRVDWTGGGILETTTALGVWEPLPWATSPHVEPLGSASNRFYRVQREP